MEAYCFQAYADALEVIPTTLAENAGLNPIAIVTELRNRHALGEKNAGINIRKVSNQGTVSVKRIIDYPHIGTDFQHPGGRRSTAPPSLDQRDRTGNGDCMSAPEDR